MEETVLTIPGRYDRLQHVAMLVIQAARQAGLDDVAAFQCQMAVDEACSNIIGHGYGGEGRGDIRIVCQAERGRVTVTLHDRGTRFDPTAQPIRGLPATPDELGRRGLGLRFIQVLVDEVRFASDDTGNQLTLVKVGSAS